MATQTPTLPVVSKTPSWDKAVTPADTVRWAEWDGHQYKLTLDRTVKLWDIEEVATDGIVTGATRHGVNLGHARKIIAGLSL